MVDSSLQVWIAVRDATIRLWTTRTRQQYLALDVPGGRNVFSLVHLSLQTVLSLDSVGLLVWPFM